MGIAQNEHPNEDIKNMTRERANAIYYRDYYNWNGLNKLPYPKKMILQHQSHSEIRKDSRKDLQNNLYGSNLGYNNPNQSCEDLLDDRRTPNMRKLGIR